MIILIAISFLWAFLSYILDLKYVYKIQVLVSLINLIIGISLVYSLKAPTYTIFALYKLLFLDPLNAILILIILTISFLVSIYSTPYMKKEGKHIPISKVKEFYFWMNTFISTMLVVALSNNFGLLWIGIEGTTLATTFLISFYRNKESVEAGWKYIMLCSIGIALALFGIIVLYYASFSVLGGGMRALDWTSIYAVANKLNPKLLLISFAFIVVGFGTKVGFAPLHFWLPDAHGEAPTPISALMSGVLLNCALYSIIRIQAILNHQNTGELSSKLLMFFGIFTIIVSSLFIIRQTDYKRLLAYSSMEHMGIIAFAIGMNTNTSIFFGLYHLINHALVKTSIFMSVGSILTTLHSKNIQSIKGLFKSMPYTSILLLLSVFAITGMPPFSTFVSELFIILTGFKMYMGLTIIFVFALVLIFGGFIYHFLGMMMGDTDQAFKEDYLMLLPIGILLTLSVVSSFYIPDKLITLMQNASLIIGGR